MVALRSTLPRWYQYQQVGHQRDDKQHQKPPALRQWLGLASACAVTYLWFESSWRWSAASPGCGSVKSHVGLPLKDIPRHLQHFQDCSINNLAATNLTFLDTASPLPVAEFVYRRDRLAQALYNEGLEAFLVEPGYTFSYYANVTQPQWEVWVSQSVLSFHIT